MHRSADFEWPKGCVALFWRQVGNALYLTCTFDDGTERSIVENIDADDPDLEMCRESLLREMKRLRDPPQMSLLEESTTTPEL